MGNLVVYNFQTGILPKRELPGLIIFFFGRKTLVGPPRRAV